MDATNISRMHVWEKKKALAEDWYLLALRSANQDAIYTTYVMHVNSFKYVHGWRSIFGTGGVNSAHNDYDPPFPLSTQYK